MWGWTQGHMIHGAGLIWYSDAIPSKSLYFNFREAHIIGATVTIANMIDASFNHPDNHNLEILTLKKWKRSNATHTPPDVTLLLFKSHLTSLATGFSAMNDALNFSVADIFYNLSECTNNFVWSCKPGKPPELRHINVITPVTCLVYNNAHSWFFITFCYVDFTAHA